MVKCPFIDSLSQSGVTWLNIAAGSFTSSLLITQWSPGQGLVMINSGGRGHRLPGHTWVTRGSRDNKWSGSKHWWDGGMWSMFCPGQDSNYLASNSLFCWSCKIMINRNLTFLWLVSLHCHAWCQTGGLCSTLCHKALWAPSPNKYSHGNTQFNQNKIETFDNIKLFNSISDRTEVCTFENKSFCFDSMDDRPHSMSMSTPPSLLVSADVSDKRDPIELRLITVHIFNESEKN